jgi:hypothetical protein
MIVVTQLTRTCDACPAQWEGLVSDGRHVYVRYRWGYLSVRVSEDVNPTDRFAAVDGPEVFGAELGDEFHGYLSFEELKRATAGEIEWPS